MDNNSKESSALKAGMWWIRDSANPVLSPTGGKGDESHRCMNPWIVRVDDTYRLYYSAAAGDGFQRICLATAPVAAPTEWERHGVVLDHGEEGAFDYRWVVLPNVVQTQEGWRLYYTGNRGFGEGLDAFAGIGLAVSSDGLRFERYSAEPVLGPSPRQGLPDCKGVAGGSVIELRDDAERSYWRFYYTGFPTLGTDLFLNQQKVVCYAESYDGVQWDKKGAIMFRNPHRDYIDVAAAGPVVWRDDCVKYRMLLSAIGSRWGYYSICYAESDDGVHWRSGTNYGDDLVLGPRGDGWERQMVEYPTVCLEEWPGRVSKKRLRLFYCGNGYGQTGIGTAVEAPLRATGFSGTSHLQISAPEDDTRWLCQIPSALRCADNELHLDNDPEALWKGPTGEGMIWYESDVSSPAIPDVRIRVLVKHRDFGLELKLTVINNGMGPVPDLRGTICIEAETPGGGDGLKLTWDREVGPTPLEVSPDGANRTQFKIGLIEAGETKSVVGRISFNA